MDITALRDDDVEEEESYIITPKVNSFVNTPSNIQGDRLWNIPRFESNIVMPIERTPQALRELGVAYLWNFELENAAKVLSVYKSSDLRTALHDAETYLFLRLAV